MQINLIDLTPTYIRCMSFRRWRDYEGSYPPLFQHYHLYWAGVNAEYFLRSADVVREKTALLKSRLPFVEKTLTKKGFADEVVVVLFVGKGTTNGHAFWDERRQRFVVWLPVESYATPKQVEVFATHEVIHALHYTRCPDLYFRNAYEMKLVGRQILTEGLATFGTMQVLDDSEVMALWADYVSLEFADRWYKACQNREQEMLNRVLTEWKVSQRENGWFMMWDEADVTRYRGGYYVGLRVIKEVSRRYRLNLEALLSLPARELEELAIEVIFEKAANHRA